MKNEAMKIHCKSRNTRYRELQLNGEPEGLKKLNEKIIGIGGKKKWGKGKWRVSVSVREKGRESD